MDDWTLQDAKNRLSEVVERAQAGVPQPISKRGKPAVVVISQADYDALRDPKRPRTLAEAILAMPQGGDDDFEFERTPLVFRAVEW